MKQLPMYVCLLVLLILGACKQDSGGEVSITARDVEGAEVLVGVDYTKVEVDSMMEYLQRCLDGYKELREFPLENSVAPAFHFDPRPWGFQMPVHDGVVKYSSVAPTEAKPSAKDIAFMTVPQLAYLLKNQVLTSVGLTHMYLTRMGKYDPKLEAVVTMTRERALERAKKADEEIAAGNYRGPLHGIPYGIKDLFALEGHKTTWGAEPFKDQVIDHTATVIRKLDDAGAILIAKLASGELANGDVWFGGKAKNPWDTEQGASGSSAGPGSATAAGLVGFSIGTETWGSIISPSSRCGITGLRPTYGMVSRDGCMTLSWTLDKIGPMCRSAEGCALVFDAIRGPDGLDRSVVDAGFSFQNDRDLTDLKVGYLGNAFEKDTTERGANGRNFIETLKIMNLNMDTLSLPGGPPWMPVIFSIIRGEAGAVFDDLVLNNGDDQLTRQGRNSRASSLRVSRFIPAVEYVNANRHRAMLMEAMAVIFQKYDVLIVPSSGTDQSTISNMTGHPAVSVPNGFDDKGRPTSIIFLGKLYDEGTLLELAHQYQLATDFDEKHPAEFY